MARLTTGRLHRWLEPRILAVDHKLKVVKGRMEDEPDRMVNIRKGVGRGETMEGLYEQVMWQIESRGRQNSVEDAEEISEIVDHILLSEAINTFFEECHILASQWAGSGPQQVIINDPPSRFMYSCNYTIESSVN